MDDLDPNGEEALKAAIQIRQIMALCKLLELLGNYSIRAVHNGHGDNVPFAIVRHCLDHFERDFLQMHIDEPELKTAMAAAVERAKAFNIEKPNGR